MKYIVFAGVNGAGKSSLYNNLLQQEPNEKLGKRINTDEIVKEIGNWQVERDQIEAARIAIKKIKEYLNTGETFNQETTLCGNSILKNIKNARKLGYEIELYFVSVDRVEISKERIKRRVENGGHGIPDEKVEKRFVESRINLLEILDQCDKIIIYDNSEILTIKIIIEKGTILYSEDELPTWMNEVKNKLQK